MARRPEEDGSPKEIASEKTQKILLDPKAKEKGLTPLKACENDMKTFSAIVYFS